MLKFLIFPFIPIMLFAQNPRDYFPTHLGDMWQYLTSDGYYENWTIVKDSLDSLSNEYVDFEISWVGYSGSYMEYYMIDTLDQVWLINNADFKNNRALYYKLRATFGDWYLCGNYNGYNDNKPFFAYVYDTTATSKTYMFYESSAADGNPDSSIYSGSLFTLKVDIGKYSEIGEFYTSYLNGAIINGVQYGTIYYDTTAIEDDDIPLFPQKPQIVKTYPNPFNSQVKIEYFLPNPGRLKIEIYNILGQKVNTIFNGYARQGKNKIIWDGTLLNQQPAASGLYFVQLYFSGVNIIKRVLLVK